MTTATEHPIVAALRDDLRRAGDPARAREMAAYMKDVQPFRGVPKPERSARFRAAWKTHPVTTRQDWEAVVRMGAPGIR